MAAMVAYPLGGGIVTREQIMDKLVSVLDPYEVTTSGGTWVKESLLDDLVDAVEEIISDERIIAFNDGLAAERDVHFG